MNLAVIGTVFVDIKGYPLGDFHPTGRNAGRIQQFHGGVARNIAEDIANYGQKATMVGLVEDSGIGSDVVNHLQNRGVDTSYIRATEDGMGTWLAIFDKSGDVYASISKRTNLLPICDILKENGDKIFSEADAILLEIDIDEPIVEMVFELNKKYNKKIFSVISNITVAKERMDFILQSDCFICNEQEAVSFFSCDESQFATKEAALATLQSYSEKELPKAMVVTLGSKGAAFYSYVTGESGAIPSCVVKVVDTTGAGDSFFAGTSIGLAEGNTLEQSCILGRKLASNVIQSIGNVYMAN